jgi:hypothetical protein
MILSSNEKTVCDLRHNSWTVNCHRGRGLRSDIAYRPHIVLRRALGYRFHFHHLSILSELFPAHRRQLNTRDQRSTPLVHHPDYFGRLSSPYGFAA